MTEKVSIVIPVHNGAATIKDTLRACLDQQADAEIETIVVDDGSSDRTSEIAGELGVNCIRQEQGGPAKARNTGWRAASGDIVCFTDSDCIPEDKWISKLLASYTDPKVAAVGGSYDIANGNSLLAKCIHEEIVQRHLQIPKYPQFLGSFNFSCRRSILEEVGGFDESFTSASAEDNDLSYRIVSADYVLAFDQSIKVTHRHTERLRQYLREQVRHGYWRAKLYRKHPRMSGGDNYSGIIDFIQPPLAILTLLCLPMVFLARQISILFGVLLLSLLVLQMPAAIGVINRTRNWRDAYLVPLTFLRSFARGIGLVAGFMRFFILDRN